MAGRHWGREESPSAHRVPSVRLSSWSAFLHTPHGALEGGGVCAPYAPGKVLKGWSYPVFLPGSVRVILGIVYALLFVGRSVSMSSSHVYLSFRVHSESIF